MPTSLARAENAGIEVKCFVDPCVRPTNSGVIGLTRE